MSKKSINLSFPSLNKGFLRLLFEGAIFSLLFCFLGTSAHSREYTWDKFGHSSETFVDYSGRDRTYQGNIRFPTPAETCNGVTALFKSLFPSSYYPYRACPIAYGDSLHSQVFACSPTQFECAPPESEPFSYNDEIITIWPACRSLLTLADMDAINQNASYGARGRVRFNFKENKCHCFDSNERPQKALYPDFVSGYCYQSPRLDLEYNPATHTGYSPLTYAQYDRKAPDKVLSFKAYARLIANSRLTLNVNPPNFNIVVQTTNGEPGKISNQQVDSAGVVTFDYTFPSFSQAKTDTVVVTCDVCSEFRDRATMDITMAPTLVGFFNGVWNTRDQASDGLAKLELQATSVKGKQNLKFELFYNQTGSRTGSTSGLSALQDLAEVFDQRSRELDGVLSNRWETFWDITSAQHASVNSGIGGLLRLLGSKASDLASLVDSIFNATLNRIVAEFARRLSDPPTAADLAAHNAKLQKYAEDGYPVVLIAHSQGNLFVNSAFDTLRRSKPDAPAKVVHIAPASPTLRGDYALANIDLVINGLRLLGASSVPPINLTMVSNVNDISGHTLIGTYLDATRAALERIKSMIKAALESV